MKQVLVLLAGCNGEKYIDEMIDSVLKQDHTDWTLVLSDDNSFDRTAEIFDSYAQKYPDKIIHYKSGQRFGSAGAHFMHLLALYHDAPYIMFCDQDDVWHTDKISKTLAVMQEAEQSEKPVLVHTDLCVVDQNLDRLDDSFLHFSKLDGSRVQLKQLLVQNVVTGCTVMINRKLAQIAADCIPASGMLMHDWWLALIASATGKIAFLNQSTIDYRQHESNSVGAKNTRSAAYILNKLKDNRIKSALDATFDQAQALLECCGSHIADKDALQTVKDYAALKNKGSIGRKVGYVKGGFYKFGLTRIAGQLLLG